MRIHIVTIVFVLLALVGCREDNRISPKGKPGIELEQQISVPLEGGEAAIGYEITNAVEGGQIEAVPSESWLGAFNCDSPGRIIFNVEANTTPDTRSAIVTVTYTYGEEQYVSEQVNVIQSRYDYNTECTYLSGTYYGTKYGSGGEHNYFTIISDMEYLDGRQDGGTYYAFDIYTSSAPDEAGTLMPPAGTYALGEAGATSDMTFSPDYSQAIRSTVDGAVVFEVYFTEGTLDISYEGKTMTAEASLVDTEGGKHYLVYSGKPDYDDASGGSGGDVTLNHDVDIASIQGRAQYVSDDCGVMEVLLSFTDMEVDFFGFVTPPGSTLTVDMFMPYDESGAIATGKYDIVAPASFEAFSMYPGEYASYMGMTVTMGTYVSYIDESGNTFEGLIDSGVMNIQGEPGDYTVQCDFVTAQGYSVRCSYTGALEIVGLPGAPYSSLIDDYTLDLQNASGSAEFWGDYYGNGAGNWLISLKQAGGDCVDFDIISESLDYSTGLSTAVYTPSVDSKNPVAGEYVTGYLNDNYLMGTNYMASDSYGYLYAYAPAVDGDLNITDNGDGTHTISFAFTDDLGHVWNGEWTGVLSLSNKSNAPMGNTPRARVSSLRHEEVPVVESVRLRLSP